MKKTQKAEAQQGCHDDRVMALGIAHYIKPQQKVQTAPKPQRDKKYRTKPLTIEEIIKPSQRNMSIGRGDELIVI